MAEKTSAAAGLAEKLVQSLRAQRDQGGDTYPLTLKALVERADPEADADLLAKAVKHKTFTSQVVLAQKKNPDTPLALADDVERLANSRLLLEWLLEQVCTPKAPAQPVDKLVKKVDAPLRAPLQQAIDSRIRDNALPETVASLTLRQKQYLYLKRMPPPKDPVAELAEKLIQALRARRDQDQGYPLPLQQLLDEVVPDVDPPLVKKALNHEAFAPHVVRLGKEPEATVALAEDRNRLAASTAALEYALARVCTPRRRTATLVQLEESLPSWAQPLFVESVRRRLADGTLPDTVGVVMLEYPLLYRTALPPEAAFVLAEKLLHDLREERARGRVYPTTLAQLVQDVQPGASPTLIHKAIADKEFKKMVVLAMAKNLETPVVLRGDEHILASSPLLMEFVLSVARTESNQAIPVTDLKRKLSKDLQRPFESAVQDGLAGFALPAGVGALRIKKKEYLFLLRDVNTAGTAPREEAAALAPAALAAPLEPEARPTVDFHTAFDEAFTRLDQQRGAPNFVSLVDLRRELPFDRATFDAELHKLRRAGLYTLNAAEGRHGVTPEEQEAALREEGTLLLFVARKTSV